MVKNNSTATSRILSILFSIGLFLWYTYWVIIMFVNFKYEVTDNVGYSLIYQSHYWSIIQHLTSFMYYMAVFSLFNLWIQKFIKEASCKIIIMFCIFVESIVMAIVLYQITLLRHELNGLATQTVYLESLHADYFLLYIPHVVYNLYLLLVLKKRHSQ